MSKRTFQPIKPRHPVHAFAVRVWGRVGRLLGEHDDFGDGFDVGYDAALHDHGILTGESAEAIRREVEFGTPDTPERRATFARADAIYRAQNKRTSEGGSHE